MSKLVDLIVSETGLPPSDVLRLIRSAPRRYKVYRIPKRSGGEREIAQPAREIKLLQRVLVDKVLSSLPVHRAATAYMKGCSIAANASYHAGSGPILKMDFRDFFPSIRAEDWVLFCRNTHVFDENDAELSAQILFRRAKHEHVLKLSIGAPSSPILSNILLMPFDTMVMAEASKRHIRYTRYADDLTFSGQRIGMLKDMIDVVRLTVRQVQRPKLTVNLDKTTFVTAKHRRVVTGVTLANDGLLSLGHDKKRRLSAAVHRAIHGGLDSKELLSLSGDLAFAKVIEPSFLDRLARKYGPEAVQMIRHAPRQS
ncbi:retron St85 family RNA-directed DNA polymerase [Bradyrhizobium liaoningense]|uniref:retron St85 family RNA-directed DNA polymerase n=1 Tax=Bradyrhizobium liaoningense TaxID=43992 RepID=UPI001BA802D2|nr:retron St85 family RNA-directed DNA polymerase [Bradyrhizobium liaoningense]MBR0846096.1 retron St85 family RNA-directed DNA polymerase [Bradyrhizobium liaoningense]